MANDYNCEDCEGLGVVCVVHGNTIGCDCEEDALTEACETCGGTGVAPDPDDDDEED